LTGTLIDDPDAFEVASRTARELIGLDLIATIASARDSHTSSSVPLGVFDLVRAFGRVEAWIAALRAGQQPSDPADLVRFGMVCHILNTAAAFGNSDHFYGRLRDTLKGDQLDQFEDVLFEGEVAVYWSEQMEATDIAFGPPSGHPDLWVTLLRNGAHLRLALECKRIQTVATEMRRLNEVAVTLEVGYQQILEKPSPLKCIIWLHQPVENSDVPVMLESIRALASALPADSTEDQWITCGSLDGAFQISLAQLGRAAKFQTPGPIISDVPAEPIFLPRVEVQRRNGDNFVSRVKSLLSVRSDQHPNRIRSVRDNVSEAIDQLADYLPGQLGVVAIRIPPPRALGDLWEAERAVRGSLVRKAADHVALVVFFWAEGKTDSVAVGDPSADTHNTTVVSHSFRRYFISNSACRLRCDQIDSQESVFAQPPTAFVRDFPSGDIRPIDPAQLAAMEEGGDLPPMIAEALDKVGGLPEDSGEACAYMKFKRSLRTELGDGLLGVIKAGKRQFRIFMQADAHLRVVEITGGMVRAGATIDLRAWLSQDELGLVLSWHLKGFSVSLWCADEVSRVSAMSSRVAPVAL